MLAKPLLWLCPLVLLASAQDSAKDKAKKDLERMQGTWTMHALEINGKEVGPKQIGNTQLVVKADEYRTKVKDKLLPGFKIKLDPSKEPAHIDMIISEPGSPDKVYKGIYKLEKDTFKMCRGSSPEQERPNQFATWPDTNMFVVTWKKQ